MFVLTAKLSKRKLGIALAAVVFTAAAVTAGVMTARSGAEAGSRICSGEDAAQYLASLGWETPAEPKEVREVAVPREFGGVYADYAALQKRQGFRLEKYAGMKATRYTFDILNYPTGEKGIVADLLVFGEEVIAGDVQSPAADGFMEGLRDRAGGTKAR